VLKIENGEGKLVEEIYRESVLIYVTGKSRAGKTIHLLSDMTPNSNDPRIKYHVLLEEGENTARVYDPDNNFSEEHLKRKIQIHLDQKKQGKGEQI